MANVNILASYTIQDADGERAAFPVYSQVDDAATLADIATAVQGMGVTLDVILDGIIVKNRFTVEVALPDGIKTSPVAGSEIEVTGLLTYPLFDLPGKVYSQDIPAFSRTYFVGNKINLSASQVTDWTDHSHGGSPLVFWNDLWSSDLGEVRQGRKTFRKHRRQTERT